MSNNALKNLNRSNDSAMLHCKICSPPFLGLPFHPGAIQGTEGIKFFHLATLSHTILFMHKLRFMHVMSRWRRGLSALHPHSRPLSLARRHRIPKFGLRTDDDDDVGALFREGKSNTATTFMFMFKYGKVHFSAGRNYLLVEIPSNFDTTYYLQCAASHRAW